MRTIGLGCDHCGAPLQVREDANFVTCNYCEARLAVERSESVTMTRVVEELGERAESLEAEVAILKLRERLRRREEKWRAFKKKVFHDADFIGPPNPLAGYIVAFFLGVLGLVLLVGGFATGDGRALLYGVVLVPVAAVVAWHPRNLVRRFHREQARYLKERRQIHRAIADLRRGAEAAQGS